MSNEIDTTKFDMEGRALEKRKVEAMERIAEALESIAVDEGCHLDLLTHAVAEISSAITVSVGGGLI